MVNRRKQNKRIPAKFSTINNVQNKLMNYNGNNKAQHMSPYLMCRLEPFGNSELIGIPDKATNRRLVVDHRLTNTFQSDSSDFNIHLLPANKPCLISTDGATIVGGVSSPAGNGLRSVLGITGFNNINYGDSDNGPYQAQSARIVGMAWKITYLGRSADASGVVVATYVPADLQNSEISPLPLQTLNSDGTLGPVIPNTTGVRILGVDLANSIAIAPDSVTTRIEASPWGVLKRVKPENRYKPWYDSPGVLVFGNSFPVPGTRRAIVRNATDAPAQTFHPFYFYDDDWTTTQLRLQGMANQLMRIDVQLCVEYNVGVSSATFSLTKAPPTHDPFALEMVRSIESKVPAAMASNSLTPKIPIDKAELDMNKVANKVSDLVDMAKYVSNKPQPMPQRTVPRKGRTNK